MTDDTAAVRRSGVRVLGLGFLVLFVLLCAAAVLSHLAWQSTPDYWNQQQERIDAMSQEQRAATSQSLFNRIVDLWSAGPTNWITMDDLIGQRTTIEIPYHDLNVWIKQDGIVLLEDVGISLPRSVKGAMVDSPGDGLLRITCELDRGNRRQVVALVFDIKVSDDGTITSRLQSATMGRLRLPTQTAIDLIAERGGGGRLIDLMQGNPIEPIQLPIDPTEDGLRDGRLVGLQVRDDAILVTRESVLRQPTND